MQNNDNPNNYQEADIIKTARDILIRRDQTKEAYYLFIGQLVEIIKALDRQKSKDQQL